jgi:hypothetical protein
VEILDETDPATGEYLVKQMRIRLINKASLLAYMDGLAARQQSFQFAPHVNNQNHETVETVVKVPAHLAKPRRFVVRVAGESMEPTLRIGELVIFEYHRSLRSDREIVMANLPEFGPGTHGRERSTASRRMPNSGFSSLTTRPTHQSSCHKQKRSTRFSGQWLR